MDRPLKRRLSATNLAFFTPAASSFRPRPYSCRPTSSHHPAPVATRALPPIGMDPEPTDPDVVFLHPPFTNFPGADKFPDGLSYMLMADNPDWFLDPTDFVSEQNTNTKSIPYPSHLEPPRGWCPAKKKDLKGLSSDSWPPGDQPRLRCTFCRRTYAGVNAKSMWRRHVYEKHKIAMSNRREGSDRPRGRGHNKENRPTIKCGQIPHESIFTIGTNPRIDPVNPVNSSKLRCLLPAVDTLRSKSAGEADSFSSPLTLLKGDLSYLADSKRLHHPLTYSHLPPVSPLHSPLPISPPSGSDNHSEDLFQRPSSPASTLSVVPPSPYNPLLTPSFRHSPPPLPSDQPWRFPSPSHPLHSRSRDVSLSMLLRESNSPNIVKSTTPFITESPHPINSPTTPRTLDTSAPKRSTPDPGTPQRQETLSHLTPKVFLHGRHLRHQKLQYLIQGSPLQRTASPSEDHRPQLSELRDEMIDVSVPTRATIIDAIPVNSDPFAIIYSPWRPNMGRQEPSSSPIVISGTKSPVVRNVNVPSDEDQAIARSYPMKNAFQLPHSSPSSRALDVVDEEEIDTKLPVFLDTTLAGRLLESFIPNDSRPTKKIKISHSEFR